ncbi:hypothetical protein GCM10017600_76870 [Streptosporangium carneum]|uniref:Uncharacterized protein n=1 Tax=Streptosporangium carneum TaxID=47481 RepID=A0A9W6MHK4_9ACTN|nr:hypothetical protein GCM10017600_76870 [Streptosporangium carneum]
MVGSRPGEGEEGTFLSGAHSDVPVQLTGLSPTLLANPPRQARLAGPGGSREARRFASGARSYDQGLSLGADARREAAAVLSGS